MAKRAYSTSNMMNPRFLNLFWFYWSMNQGWGFGVSSMLVSFSMNECGIWVSFVPFFPELLVSDKHQCVEKLSLIGGKQETCCRDQKGDDHIGEGIFCNTLQHGPIITISSVQNFYVPVDSFMVAFLHLYIAPYKGNEENQPYKLSEEKNIEGRFWHDPVGFQIKVQSTWFGIGISSRQSVTSQNIV